MKTKQVKEEDKTTDEETVIEPKTRARKKASDIVDEKSTQDEPKTSKDAKKQPKPRAIVKKRPLGIRKALRSKKAAIVKEKVKNVIKSTRGRKPAVKIEPGASQDKDTEPLIPPAEIKKEPVEETSPSSRSSSPKTAGRRVRVSSDMAMMKTLLSDTPGTLVLGPRTSPYSMRSERSNSPSLFEGKNLRSGKPRKVKNNLLSEVVLKEQKKRRRLLSDSKNPEPSDVEQDCKKLKRGRSCSRDGSEISKCSDNTESDLSLSETLNDSDSRELNKKLDKSKTDLDVDIENSIQISTIEKVPSLINSKTEPTLGPETGSIVNETKRKSSLHRSTSLDSDNNNSDRQKLDALNADVEDKILLKTETDRLFEARSNILTSMSKKFNSKEMSKNIRRARRGRKAAVEGRRPATAKTVTGVATAPATLPASLPATTPPTVPATTPATTLSEPLDDKHETIETLSKDIDDLIKDLDQNIDGDHEPTESTSLSIPESLPSKSEAKPVAKFYGLTEPLSSVDDNSIRAPATPVKESVTALLNETTPIKNDDGENIRLHFEDSVEKSEAARSEITYTKCSTVASIDKLMDRLKEFEEFDKRRQRQESESKGDSKPMMVSDDVVLIPKSGAEFKQLKDMQSMRSPERTIEKENVLSCFENNSAISIVKRDHQVRKSVDVDLPNSVTLIKRNSVSARKESTSSNHSRESDAISIFEKSLGKDVTLTEIRKSVDKSGTLAQIDLHQFATLHPTNSNQTVAGCMLDSSQISITPRLSETKIGNDFQIITKRKSRESMSRKSSESTNDGSVEEKMAVIEKIKSPSHQSPATSLIPASVAVKSHEEVPLEAEALPPPVETVKPVPEIVATETLTVNDKPHVKNETVEEAPKPSLAETTLPETKVETSAPEKVVTPVEKMEVEGTTVEEIAEEKPATIESIKEETTSDKKPTEEVVKPGKKSARNSIESQPGPSNAFNETPESQKRKENVLRTLGLLTHKAAKEAKIEKAKEKERIYSGIMSNKGKAAKTSGDYTGTLKTVIKLNRSGGEKKKHRSSLKMTFQKSKYRSGKPAPELGEAAAEDSTFYTIERREIAAASSADGGQRKTYSNRLNNHDAEAVPEPTEPKETLNLVIPEKASSFSIHPGRLCMDQCFYCGGKFGLFDTPCHIAQIKSSERQKKVLDNEEKLTIDSCLCDACYRHVDRRANCPSYRKRPLKQSDAQPMTTSPPAVESEKPPSPPLEDERERERESGSESGGGGATCHTEGCASAADYCIRRKWLIKMRSAVNKVLKLKGDYPGLHTIPLCVAHYRCVSVLMACLLCRRRLTKHHNLHFIHHGYTDLNPLLAAANLPVQFTERPVLCKGCRYYCSLLQRPGHNDAYANGYRRKLLQVYNIEVPPEHEGEFGEINLDESNKQKKKQRNKSKQRKSTEPDNSSENSSEKTNESTPEKREDEKPIEEDIESLISSNKILVPGAVKSNEGSTPSEGSDENSEELPAMFNKQTELQYLLQKQNNPAQFLGQPNLTQKQRNILKLHSVSGIQKPGQQHRISEKNAKKIHKLGQMMLMKEKVRSQMEITEDKSKDGIPMLKNITLNDECTIESIPTKRAPDINTLKNKWQMSESFTQVKKNLSELSKKLTVEKEPKSKSEVKYSNPVKRLETNPSISVRELFPGEEEMNLQCNIEFNNVKGVTPEGWEKCNTTIQYDVETKKLWNELQQPYGNQSSFLRHLVLLEKFFRSGDLVLSHNATPPAANYSDSVQSRLRAYDNIANDAPRRSEPAISLIEYRKKPSINGKSLLKSNQTDDKNTKKFMPPPSGMPKLKTKDKSRKQLPPELIAINTPNAQGRKAIQNVLHNIQQLVKDVTASDPTEVAAAPLPPVTQVPATLPVPTVPVQKDPPKEKKEKSDTPKKSKTSSKPWRPTLMPLTPENLSRIAREPTQLAVDGRSLPSLVQVMSSGKRFHITLQDYNKMCIMRREKLQQLQDGEKKRPSLEDTTVVTELQPSTIHGNGGTLTQITSDDKTADGIGSNAATILKNVGLKNITIAPIPAKTATITSQNLPTPVSSPSLIMTSTPIKIPQLGPAVSITSETVLTPNLPVMTSTMVMPKIPKSLTVIPQTIVAVPQSAVLSPMVQDGSRP